MRQRPFPPAHGGGNLCEKPAPRSRTPTPRPRLKYVRSVWANRPLPLLGDRYADGCPGVSPHRPHPPVISNGASRLFLPASLLRSGRFVQREISLPRGWPRRNSENAFGWPIPEGFALPAYYGGTFAGGSWVYNLYRQACDPLEF